MPKCVLKFRTKILNKISKRVYFFARAKDREVFNYKINSLIRSKVFFKKFESHNESHCDYFSELKLQVENQIFELNSLLGDFF